MRLQWIDPRTGNQGFKFDPSSISSSEIKTNELDALPGTRSRLNRLLQFLKQRRAVACMDHGIQIDRSDEQESKTPSPKLKSLEPDSKFTFESVLQWLKQ
jgi:hypothetical protein